MGKTQTNTRYFGFQVMRDDTPLSENEKYYDKWLDEAFEHPIPEILEFYSPETIASHLGGKDVDEDEDERPSRSRNRDDDDEPVKRTRSSRDEDDEDEPPKKPNRSRLSEDLDDEIPFAGGTRRSKQAVDDDEEEDEAPPKTRSRSMTVERDRTMMNPLRAVGA